MPNMQQKPGSLRLKDAMKISARTLMVGLALAGVGSEVMAANTRKDGLAKPDPVVLRFATVGDSRQDPVGFDPTTGPLSPQDVIWLQNSKALSRILREVAAHKNQMLFFNGDMVMGYGTAGPTASNSVADVVGSDLLAFYRQYGFWRGMVATLMEAGTYVVPVPGNHEVQSKAEGKKAVAENENAWRANMGDLIIDMQRFKAIVGQEASNVNVQDNATLDGLGSDQSQLSYSFDVAEQHFTVINTDPEGNDGVAPSAWVAADLESAKARGAKHFFVFGHKPAFTYVYSSKVKKSEAAGLDKIPAQRDAFWNTIEKYGATYFCGHQHMFNLMQPRGAAWQVLVGTGGSPWDAKLGEKTLHPESDRAYAWATTEVHMSGRVDITAYGFSDTFGPTKVLGRVHLLRSAPASPTQ
jgi:hypothetical protein